MLYALIIVSFIATIEFIMIAVSRGMRKGERGIKSELIRIQTDLIREATANIMGLQKYRDGKAGLRQIKIYTNIIDDIAGQGGEE